MDIDTRTSMDGKISIRNGMAVGGGTPVNVDRCFAPTRNLRNMQMDQLLDNSVLKSWLATASGTILFVFGLSGRFLQQPISEKPQSTDRYS
jgi:hypothetical protein